MATRVANIVVTSLLLFGVVLAGCAKRPATTQASAPAPTAPPPAASTPAQPSTAAPSMAAPAPAAPAAPKAPAGAAMRPSPKEFTAIADLKDIHFDFDKYDIRPSDAKVLDANAIWLKSHGDYLILIEGHCDERGTNEYNLALGARRADASKDYIASLGISADRLSTTSYGEEIQVCKEATEECWVKNRRARFVIMQGAPRS